MPHDKTPPPAWDSPLAAGVVDRLKSEAGALLPILHALQETFGYIHADAIGLVAETLNLSRAEVHGVVSFYHDFRDKPPPPLVVKLCCAEACQACGGREAARTLLDHLGADWNQPAHGGAVVVEPVYCLGLCALAPAALIGDTLAAGFDGAELRATVDGAQ